MSRGAILHPQIHDVEFFLDAVAAGDIQEVTKRLDEGQDVNDSMVRNVPPLAHCCWMSSLTDRDVLVTPLCMLRVKTIN